MYVCVPSEHLPKMDTFGLCDPLVIVSHDEKVRLWFVVRRPSRIEGRGRDGRGRVEGG